MTRWSITTDRWSITFARWSITSARWSITLTCWILTSARWGITTIRWILTSAKCSITTTRRILTFANCSITNWSCSLPIGRSTSSTVNVFAPLRLCATQENRLAQRRKGAKKKMRRELCFTIFVSASILHQLLQRQTTTGDRATCRYELDTKRLQVGQALCPTAPAGSLLRMLAWLGRLRR